MSGQGITFEDHEDEHENMRRSASRSQMRYSSRREGGRSLSRGDGEASPPNLHDWQTAPAAMKAKKPKMNKLKTQQTTTLDIDEYLGSPTADSAVAQAHDARATTAKQHPKVKKKSHHPKRATKHGLKKGHTQDTSTWQTQVENGEENDSEYEHVDEHSNRGHEHEDDGREGRWVEKTETAVVRMEMEHESDEDEGSEAATSRGDSVRSRSHSP